MSAVELPSFEPGSAEWYEQRRSAVGGSEIAPILGIGKWDSRFALWHRKSGVLAPQDDNPEMDWGRRLEPVILGKYADDHPDVEVVPGGTFAHADRPWQIASPDAMLGERLVVVEAKTQRDDRDHLWGEPGTDEIPVYYRAQVQWYMDVLGAERCDVAVLISGSDYREYLVHYDADEAAFMRTEARAFLDSIERNERPDIDAHQATYLAVRELHPDIEPVDVELDAALVREYCTARRALADAKAEDQRVTSLVADALGSARRATFLGDTIATRQARGDGTPYLVAGRNLPSFDTKAA